MSQTKYKDVQILREGDSETGPWAIATLSSAGVSHVAIRCHQPSQSAQMEEWYVLPELLACSVMHVAHWWQSATEEEIRRGYEEMAAYEASTDDPYPYDLPPDFEQTEGKAA